MIELTNDDNSKSLSIFGNDENGDEIKTVFNETNKGVKNWQGCDGTQYCKYTEGVTTMQGKDYKTITSMRCAIQD